MKFTKEDVVESIKTSYKAQNGNTGLKLSERTVAETIDTLLVFADEEISLEDFVAKVRPAIDSANKNLIKEQSDFVKNYKPAEPPTPPKPPTPPTPPDGLDMTAFIKQLTDANKAAIEAAVNPLQTKLMEMELAKSRETLLNNVKMEFQKKNPDPSRKAYADKAFNTVTANLASDAKVEDVVAAWDKEFNELCSLTGVKPYLPVDAQGKPVEGKTPFQQSVDAVTAKDANAANTAGIKERLGIPSK
jgi:hypothetical protein